MLCQSHVRYIKCSVITELMNKPLSSLAESPTCNINKKFNFIIEFSGSLLRPVS